MWTSLGASTARGLCLAMMCTLGAAHTLPSLAGAQSAQHEASTRLSEQHRLMIGGSISGYWSDETGHAEWRQWNDWEVQIAPSVTYFVLDGVGVGVSGGGSVAQRTQQLWDERTKALHVGVHTIQDVRLGHYLSVMPTLSASWRRTWNQLLFEAPTYPYDPFNPVAATSGVVAASERHSYRAQFARFEGFLPLVFQASTHVGLGVGPTLWVDVFLARDPEPGSDRRRPGAGPIDRNDPEQRARIQLGASTWMVISL